MKIGIIIIKGNCNDKSTYLLKLNENAFCRLWVSPLCPRLPDGSSEDDAVGPTAFKTSLLEYLNHYNLPILKNWIDYVKMADFSQIRYIVNFFLIP